METEELLCIKNLNIDDNIELDIYEGFPWTDFDFHHNLATVWSVLIVSFVNGGCLGDFFYSENSQKSWGAKSGLHGGFLKGEVLFFSLKKISF